MEMEKYFFRNDYNDIGYPDVLDALKDALNEKNPGYGFDKHTKNAERLIKDALADENVEVHFVAGGTIANILGCAVGMRQEESILAATSGHIQGHEAGAIEATGLKIETIDTEDGKLSVELLANKLSEFGPEFTTVPRKIYISNTTELGSLYTKKEIKDIYDFAKENGLYLYIDGARMAAALANPKSNLKLEDLSSICDAFTLGGTKNGFLLGEAIVLVNDELKPGFMNLKKQKGAILAKGFVAGIIFETVFSAENGYLKGAIHAHEMAGKLARSLEDIGINLHQKFESNQIFIELNDERVKKLKASTSFELMGKSRGNKNIVRFVTSYRTSLEEVEGLLSEIKKLF